MCTSRNTMSSGTYSEFQRQNLRNHERTKSHRMPEASAHVTLNHTLDNFLSSMLNGRGACCQPNVGV